MAGFIRSLGNMVWSAVEAHAQAHAEMVTGSEEVSSERVSKVASESLERGLQRASERRIVPSSIQKRIKEQKVAKKVSFDLITGGQRFRAHRRGTPCQVHLIEDAAPAVSVRSAPIHASAVTPVTASQDQINQAKAIVNQFFSNNSWIHAPNLRDVDIEKAINYCGSVERFRDIIHNPYDRGLLSNFIWHLNGRPEGDVEYGFRNLFSDSETFSGIFAILSLNEAQRRNFNGFLGAPEGQHWTSTEAPVNKDVAIELARALIQS